MCVVGHGATPELCTIKTLYNMLKITETIWVTVLAIGLQFFSVNAFSQAKDSTTHVLNVKGAVSATNNGFSFIPTFSLGQPATIFNFNVNSGKRLSFEPELRFSLEGKPWSFIFIWRYKLVNASKFQLTLGTHLPAISFRTVPVIKNDVALDVIQAQRFFPVAEVLPNFTVTQNISVGMFYLYGHGFEADLTKHTHFVSFRTQFSKIKLSNKYFLKFNPQIYYLKMDSRAGFYAASNLTLARQNFPFSISTMMNKQLKSDISGKNFDWNISLAYAFGKRYTR